MAFTSLRFLYFFPTVVLFYFLLPKKYKAWLLLAASYYFYLNANPSFGIVLFATSIFTWAGGLAIARASDGHKRKVFVTFLVGCLVFSLLIFKYYTFINQNVSHLLALFGLKMQIPKMVWLLPLGISYFTFQAIGYLMDVYRRRIEAEKSPGYLLLFLSFFPTVVSGPIERAGNMLVQYRNPGHFVYDNAVAGLRLMLWGYFTKLVVADGLGVYIDEIYSGIDAQNASTLWLVVLLYPLQLYCDFSGYSNIAIGTAKILGIDVMQNFRRPYLFADSITNFWRRNHISLTTWLTDYIYTPLTIRFRQYEKAGVVLAVVITFLIAGIWHGAAWTFVVYGLIHGILLGTEAYNQKKRSKWEKRNKLKQKIWYIALTCLVTYLLVCFSFIFFRSSSLTVAADVLRNLFSHPGRIFFGSSSARLGFSLLTLILVMLSDFRDEYFPSRFRLFENKHRAIRWISYFAILFLILLLGNFNSQHFIYLQF